MPRFSSVFVVVKNGRRLEDINYISKAAAYDRLNALRANISKSYATMGMGKDPSTYEVREVDKPNKVW